MRLSKRGEHAFRALIDFGIAAEQGRPRVQIWELVAKEKLPAKFLEQIFLQFKEARLNAARRGMGGGDFLVEPAAKISIGSVVRMIDEPLAPIACVSQTASERRSCPDEEHCGLRMRKLMFDVRNAIANILDRYTLAEVVEIALRKLKRSQPPSPFAVL